MEEFMARYEVEDKLGKGAYGTVFRCKYRATGDKYAAKIMSKAKLGEKNTAQAQREVKLQSELHHPGVTAVRESFEDAESIIVILELVTGGELFRRLTELQHYSERTACEIMHNLMRILDYIHGQGVVHRDLKPDNMLLTESQTGKQETSNIKLADFGFACHYRGVQMTQACGTPYYIAPELLNTAVFRRQPHYEPPACDMWSAGVIAYLLLAGYPPFRVAAHDQNAKQKLFRQIVEGNVVFDKGQAWDQISDNGKDLVRRLLEVDPATRITAAEALEHPWFADLRLISDAHLSQALDELTSFNAREKVKGAFLGVEAAFVVLFTDSCRKRGITHANTGIIQTFMTADEPLEELDLDNNYLGPKGMESLIEVVHKHPHMKVLKLRNVLLNNEQAINLTQQLQAPDSLSQIHVLDLSHNPLSQTAGRALLGMLQKQKRVTECNLESTHVGARLIRKINEQAAVNRAAREAALAAEG
eukprot:TRINITY_DN61200_c0_g1_i1.p1 TRINITY_DN61200_c0_g1~~TRINITY_DN61200_c0_g1_i1.p1  ORF type:complete len:501 (+),score=172.56 TRINITY_DN61200_c0_g1_i1:81-1505(+)